MLNIVKAQDRLKGCTGIKMVVAGKYGVGKTTLLKTLPPENTLCLDLEAGLLSVREWQGDVVTLRTWDEARDLACLVGGPDPSKQGDHVPYSREHYNRVSSQFGLGALDKYATFFETLN